MMKRLENDFQNDTHNDENAVCPWCGHEHSDCWEWSDSDDECECAECGKFFAYDTDVVRTFSACRVAEFDE